MRMRITQQVQIHHLEMCQSVGLHPERANASSSNPQYLLLALYNRNDTRRLACYLFPKGCQTSSDAPSTRERIFPTVSLDYLLCPEVKLFEGHMLDVCDALEWARYKLPHLALECSELHVDGERVVVI